MTQIPKIVVKDPIRVKDLVVMSPVTVQAGGGTIGGSALWTGEGPPTAVVGATVNDEYLDILTGTLYRLDPGA